MLGLLHDIEYGARRREFWLLNPRMDPHLNPEMQEPLRDAWACILWGRHNAGLMMLGATIEAALRQVVEVHLDVHVDGSIGDLVAYCEEHDLVPHSYLEFAQQFRQTVRNLWQHQDGRKIAAGGSVRGFAIVTWSGDEEMPLAQRLEDALRTYSEEPENRQSFTADDHPWVTHILKLRIEEALAPALYNQTWQWLNYLSSRMLRQKHYDERRQRGAPVRRLKRRLGKGGTSTWHPPVDPLVPFEERPLPRFRPRRTD